MTLTFLGAGSAFSRRYQTTCSLIQTVNQERWLMDCGRQAPEQLSAQGLSWHHIDGQFITHAHGDHIYGLEEFAFARYYASMSGNPSIRGGGARPRFVAHRAVASEVWESLAPSLRYIERVGHPAKDGAMQDYFEMVEELRGAGKLDESGFVPWEEFSVSGMEIRARIVPHVPFKPSCGFEIAWEQEGETYRFWWGGDSRVERGFLIEASQRCSVLFQDCSFAPNGGAVHGDFQELLSLPPEVRRKIVLMHHDDDLPRNIDVARKAGFRLAQREQVYDLASGQCLNDAERSAA